MEHIPAPYKTYPGGKSGESVYQAIINQIPPIKVMVSLFAGNGGVERRLDMKGGLLILNDLDKEVYRRYVAIQTALPPTVQMVAYNYNGLTMMEHYTTIRNRRARQTLLFADPPYLFDSRSSQRDIYNHEWDYDTHANFLKLALKASDRGYKVAITHPSHLLYENRIGHWRKVDFESVTRAGKKFRDTLWLNYDCPMELQDYSYLGDDYRDRENIKRLVRRNIKRIMTMPVLQRNKLLYELNIATKKISI